MFGILLRGLVSAVCLLPPTLLMGFGNVRERTIEPAIAAIAGLLR